MEQSPFTGEPPRRTTIYLSQWDEAAIESMKKRFGLIRTSDAIRLALRMMSGHLDADEAQFGRI